MGGLPGRVWRAGTDGGLPGSCGRLHLAVRAPAVRAQFVAVRRVSGVSARCIRFSCRRKRPGFYAMHAGGAMFRTLGVYWALVFAAGRHCAGRGGLRSAAVCFDYDGARGIRVGQGESGESRAAVLRGLVPDRDFAAAAIDAITSANTMCSCPWPDSAGWAVGRWRKKWRAGIVFAAVYAGLAVPYAVSAEERNWRLTTRVRELVEGVAGAHERHPGQAILLEGVDTDLFWNAMLDRPFRLIGLHDVYLAPGSERAITAYPERGNLAEFIGGGVQCRRRDPARRTCGLQRERSAPAQYYVELHGASGSTPACAGGRSEPVDGRTAWAGVVSGG